MIGIGRGGKILSRDCDLIIADDIEGPQFYYATSIQEKIQKTGGQLH